MQTATQPRAVFGDPEGAGVRFTPVKWWVVEVEYQRIEHGKTEVGVEACDEKEAKRIAEEMVTKEEAIGCGDIEIVSIDAECLDTDEDGEPIEDVDPTWPLTGTAPKEQMRMFDE